MTAQPTEHILPASVFAGPLPTVGAYLRCPGMGIALLLTTVRKIVGEAKPMVLLVGLRVRVVTLPAGTEILPWPRSVGRPRKAAEPPAPTDRPIQTKAMRQKAERNKVVAIRRSYSDPDNALIDPARRDKVRSAEWRDPNDTDVLRRSPRTVSGFRATDVLESLQQSGTLTRAQCGAAKRLRRDWESGCLQTNGAVDWERSGSTQGGTPIGISERKLQFLERFQNAQAAVGRLFEIVDYVCLQGGLLKTYAALHQIHPANASGRLCAAVEMLQGHYDSIDEGTERQRPVHTIGPQLGVPAE